MTLYNLLNYNDENRTRKIPNSDAAVKPTKAPSKLDNSLKFFIILVSLQTIRVFSRIMTEMSTTFCGDKLLILHEKVKNLKYRVKSRGYKLLILFIIS
jgi:hypothetical protein